MEHPTTGQRGRQCLRPMGAAAVCVGLYLATGRILRRVLQGVLRMLGKGLSAEAQQIALWVCLIAITLFSVLPALIYGAERFGIKARRLHLCLPRRNVVILVLIYGFVLFCISSPLSAITAVLVGAGGGMKLPQEPIVRVLAFIQLCPATALAEELLFRGLLLELFRRYGIKRAILLQGVIFALLHGQPAQIAFALPMGLLFGWATLWSGSLLTAIGLHCFNNILIFILM